MPVDAWSLKMRLLSKAIVFVGIITALAASFKSICALSQQPAVTNPATASAPAQPEKTPQTDPIEALAGKWDSKCDEKGCVMFTDVLIGDLDHPADSKHPEYITIAVAINRSTRKPDFFSFELPANADRKQGVILMFSKTVKDGNGWKMVEDKDSMSQLDFNSCDKESCVARVHPEILSSDGSPNIDLLDKFLNSSHIYFIYTKKGKPYRALKALFPFQRDYKHLMETELKSATP
jgi:invasion protein IalB